VTLSESVKLKHSVKYQGHPDRTGVLVIRLTANRISKDYWVQCTFTNISEHVVKPNQQQPYINNYII
jgi:hypothetical protein